MKKIIIVMIASMCAAPLWGMEQGSVSRLELENNQEPAIYLPETDAGTFLPLIEEKFNEGLPYIIAYVESTKSDTDPFFCDAHDLHSWCGGYPFNVFSDLSKVPNPVHRHYPLMAQPSSYTNTQYRDPIKRILYYIMQNQENPTFQYLCSHRETLTNAQAQSFYKNIFYANQTAKQLSTNNTVAQENANTEQERADLRELQINAAINLGNSYCENKKYQQALLYLNPIITNPFANTHQLANAHFYIGHIYHYGGDGIAQNDTLAEEHFNKTLTYAPSHALLRSRLGFIYYDTERYAEAYPYLEAVTRNNDASIKNKATALFCLGTMFFESKGVIKDATKAKGYLTQYLATPNLNASAQKVKAYVILAEIFHAEDNTQEALSCCNAILADQHATLQDQTIAHARLGSIYWSDLLGSPNYQEAHTHFNVVLENTKHLENSSESDPLSTSIMTRYNTMAHCFMGFMNYYGCGTTKDTSAARVHFNKVLNNKNIQSEFPSMTARMHELLDELDRNEHSVDAKRQKIETDNNNNNN